MSVVLVYWYWSYARGRSKEKPRRKPGCIYMFRWTSGRDFRCPLILGECVPRVIASRSSVTLNACGCRQRDFRAILSIETNARGVIKRCRSKIQRQPHGNTGSKNETYKYQLRWKDWREWCVTGQWPRSKAVASTWICQACGLMAD